MRNLKVALFLAFKSITRGQRFTIVLMIFVLSFSFVNLVFISGILNGLTEAIHKQVIDNFTSNIVVDPQEEPERKDFIIHQEELRRQIEQIPGVIATARHYELAGTFAYDKEKNGKYKYISGQIIGIDPEQEKRITRISQNMLDGHYLEGLGIGEIILGSDLAGGYGGIQEFTSLEGAKVGDKVQVTFSNGVERTYKVKGIYKVRFGFVDRLAFITSKEAESVLSVYGNASQILVKVDTSRDVEDNYMRRIQAIAPNLKVRKWLDLMGEFLSFTQALDMITFMVSAIGLVVAVITIFILIYINAVNKKRQIGILKAIGIKQTIIVYSYVFQALFYAFCGVIVGSIITFCLLGPYFTEHPLKLPIGDASLSLETSRVLYGILSLLAAGLVGGIIPSWRVAKGNILKAIWGA